VKQATLLAALALAVVTAVVFGAAWLRGAELQDADVPGGAP
jgi:hypothetical protein